QPARRRADERLGGRGEPGDEVCAARRGLRRLGRSGLVLLDPVVEQSPMARSQPALRGQRAVPGAPEHEGPGGVERANAPEVPDDRPAARGGPPERGLHVVEFRCEPPQGPVAVEHRGVAAVVRGDPHGWPRRSRVVLDHSGRHGVLAYKWHAAAARRAVSHALFYEALSYAPPRTTIW